MVQYHLELIEEVPPPGLTLLEIVVEVSGGEAEGVEGAVGVEQQDGRGLGVGQAWIVAWRN